MNALDAKGRIILNEKAIETLAAFVYVARHHQVPTELAKDENDVREVLDAITISGYAIIPEGQIDALIASLLKLRAEGGGVRTKP